jgi:tyrosine-protein kinase Etk/Wzc
LENKKSDEPPKKPMNITRKNKGAFSYHREESVFEAYLAAIVESRKMVLAIMIVASLIGGFVVLKQHTVYEATILIQVEDSTNSSKNLLGDLASMFDVKAAATAEIEIIRSNMVIAHALDKLKLDLNVAPKYFPVIGFWIARHNKKLSEPGLFGYGGYVWGDESVNAALFELPKQLVGHQFLIDSEGNGHYKLRELSRNIVLHGKVGETLKANVPGGELILLVSSMRGRAGAQFYLSKGSKHKTLQNYQNGLVIAEQGKQSGIISVKLKGANPYLISKVLNEIGREYVRQNVERKSEEAKKALVFLQEQLPSFKEKLEASEANLNNFRQMYGTIDLPEEGRLLLRQSVDIQLAINDLKQKKRELLIQYTDKHPSVIGYEDMIVKRGAEWKIIENRILKLPEVNQDLVRLNREVKVNSDLYTTLLNNEQQLRLVKAGKMGNARLIDEALVPDYPINNKPAIVLISSVAFGLMLGLGAAVARKILFGYKISGTEIEEKLGLNVYGAIPFSRKQAELLKQTELLAPKFEAEQAMKLLVNESPFDIAIEALRAFAAGVCYGLQDEQTKVIMIAGPTTSLGTTFTAANLAVLLVETGKSVVLVDADLRHGTISQCYGIDASIGLSDIVYNNDDYSQCIQTTILKNLWGVSLDVVSSGLNQNSPTEVFIHQRCKDFFQWLSTEYDYVVIDTPALLEYSDALLLLPYTNALFILARVGETSISDLREVDKRCRLAGKSVDGVLLNCVQPKGLKLDELKPSFLKKKSE